MKNKTLLFAGVLLIFAILLYKNDFDFTVTFIALLTILSYFTGILAIVIGLLFSLFSFVVSLPILSSLYGFLIVTLGKIHYILFTVLIKKTLKRSKVYRKMELKVKNNNTYKSLSALFNKVFKKAGITEPHLVKLVEVKNCANCKELVPRDSRFCPYCMYKQ